MCALAMDHATVEAEPEEQELLVRLEQTLRENGEQPIQLIGSDGTLLPLPPSLLHVLRSAAQALAGDQAVKVVSIGKELTTQQAANLLNVSRPYLVKLLDTGVIPCHLVGSHRRVRLDDVLAYRTQRTAERKQALAEMLQDAQALDLYE